MRDIWFRKANRSSLPARYQVVFFVLPIALMFGSFVPLWFLAMGLAHALGIPEHAPVREQPLGLLWFALFLAMSWIFLFAGLLCGFLLNAAILRHGMGYPWSVIREIGVCPHWLVDCLGGWRSSPTGSKDRKGHEDPMYDPHLDDLARR